MELTTSLTIVSEGDPRHDAIAAEQRSVLVALVSFGRSNANQSDLPGARAGGA